MHAHSRAYTCTRAHMHTCACTQLAEDRIPSLLGALYCMCARACACACMQLAEDRIPSLLGVLYSGGMCSGSAFDAVFEFEAELSLRAFMTQVSRSVSGSVSKQVSQ